MRLAAALRSADPRAACTIRSIARPSHVSEAVQHLANMAERVGPQVSGVGKVGSCPLPRTVLHSHFVSIEKVKAPRIGYKADFTAESWELFAIVDDETGPSIRQFDMYQRHSASVF